MNNTTIINSDNSNIANIKAQYCQTMATITDRILKFKPIIKKAIVANYTFFTRIFSKFFLHFLAGSIPSLKPFLS